MQWRGRRGSSNIEDRRGRRGGAAAIGSVGGLGVVAVVVIGWFLGVDLTPLLRDQEISLGGGGESQITQADEEAAEFVSVTLADTEEVWSAIFSEQVGEVYEPPTLVLFKNVTQSSCGNASGATGPFYCPGDRKIYLDTAFFTTMSERLGAEGDFAAAYVVAHEVAHYVQDELGILGEANRIRSQASQIDANAISVRIELQADCLAGIWARAAGDRFGSLDQGDIEEAMNAAKQIGDDTLQRRAGRVPAPHTFTHGTSEQRAKWFEIGYGSGEVPACNTFSAEQL
ncbi:hypothetical protein LX81_03392 [Palleronia aestuarii]|uniref:Metalloprotease n=1 Tax=Palleronia aestuarii TaxID=568105 RepID=A0A2W7MXY5_9RHOB|nr:neutral zinc metallopeptidase [Palleronia aestuarii]PZX13015.1 hypothetical protein LX81_03392 [Palleronia aestuarii]